MNEFATIYQQFHLSNEWFGHQLVFSGSILIWIMFLFLRFFFKFFYLIIFLLFLHLRFEDIFNIHAWFYNINKWNNIVRIKISNLTMHCIQDCLDFFFFFEIFGYDIEISGSFIIYNLNHIFHGLLFSVLRFFLICIVNEFCLLFMPISVIKACCEERKLYQDKSWIVNCISEKRLRATSYGWENFYLSCTILTSFNVLEDVIPNYHLKLTCRNIIPSYP